MPVGNRFGYGLYRDDTRYLNCWDLRLNDAPLTLLYDNSEDGYAARYVYSNPDGVLPCQKIMVERRVLIDKTVREQIRLTNYDTSTRVLSFKIGYGADFADMFEVRGIGRKRSAQCCRVKSLTTRELRRFLTGDWTTKFSRRELNFPSSRTRWTRSRRSSVLLWRRTGLGSWKQLSGVATIEKGFSQHFRPCFLRQKQTWTRTIAVAPKRNSNHFRQ